MSPSKKAMLPDPVRPTESLTEVVQRLSELSPLDYDKVRDSEAKALGVRVSTLDSAVKSARQSAANSSDVLGSIEPYHLPVMPHELLDSINETIQRFIVASPETFIAATLWIALTWFIEVVQVAPLAVITAPEKRCGKSQLLTLIGKLSRRPMTASSISPAALFRAIDAWQPTLMIDETDALLKDNEELRGLLNAGHTRDSAFVIRVVGEDFTPTRFSVWGCKALSGIGHVADTLMDRAIILELRRKLPHEQVERLRHAPRGLFEKLSAKLARFALDHSHELEMARPELPEELNDRAQDNWEPLLAIADFAGGEWPKLAREAALSISRKVEEDATQSTGVELLTDIAEVFEKNGWNRTSSSKLLEALCEDEEKRWYSYNRGAQLSPRQLGRILAGYGIKSKNINFGYGSVKKGFELSQFLEAFARYTQPAMVESKRYPLPVCDKPHQNVTFDGSGISVASATSVTNRYPSPNDVADKPNVALPTDTPATNETLSGAGFGQGIADSGETLKGSWNNEQFIEEVEL